MRSGFRDETSACKCVNGYDPSHHHHPAGGFLDRVAGRNGRIVARTSAPLCRSYTHAHIHTDQITEGYRTGKRTRPGLSCRRDLPLSGSFTFLFSSFPRQIKLSNSVPFPFFVIYSPLTDLSISSFFFSAVGTASGSTRVSIKSANYRRVVCDLSYRWFKVPPAPIDS
jgi:hypothetical protein